MAFFDISIWFSIMLVATLEALLLNQSFSGEIFCELSKKCFQSALNFSRFKIYKLFTAGRLI